MSAIVLYARATAGWRGRRAAILALIGFAALLFNCVGINLWGGGLHGGLTKNLAMRVDLQVVGSGTRHLGAGFMWRL